MDSQIILRDGMSVPVRHWAFTVDDYMQMLEAGILTEDDRVELIEGELIETSPIGDLHVACVIRLTMLFTRLIGDVAFVSVQNSLRLDTHSEPQPDIALLKPRQDYYAQAKPRPDDVLLIVEVADSSVAYDRHLKVPLYACALIPAVWLVDLNADAIEIYSQPADGTYQTVQTFHRSDHLSLVSLPALLLTVDDVLG